MKNRKFYGTANMVGKNTERIRKSKRISQKMFIAALNICGIDINPSSYSKLEGQTRIATDKEIYFIAKILKVDIEELFK